jgi:hypothetical protein
VVIDIEYVENIEIEHHIPILELQCRKERLSSPYATGKTTRISYLDSKRTYQWGRDVLFQAL